MAEGRRLVALDREVSNPGKSIRHDRPEQCIPGMAHGKRHNQRSQPQQSACGVHGAIARVAMLMQIEGEEIFVAGKFLFGHCLSSYPRGSPWLTACPGNSTTTCGQTGSSRLLRTTAPAICLLFCLVSAAC